MKTLYLEKRGCDFYGEKRTELSDVGNYRVTTTDYSVKGKDGHDYFLEFSMKPEYRYRFLNKRNGKPLKHVVREIVHDNAMIVSPEFTDAEGYTWGNYELQSDCDKQGFTYTLAGIIEAVNYISGESYEAIVFVDRD